MLVLRHHIIVCLMFALSCTQSTAWAGTWQSITSQISITQSKPVLDRINREMSTYVTLTNESSSVLAAPLRFVASDASLSISNYDVLVGDDAGFYPNDFVLQPGETTAVKINYPLSRRPLTFTPKVHMKAIEIDGLDRHEEMVTEQEGGELALEKGVTLIVPPKATSTKMLSIQHAQSEFAGTVVLGPAGSEFDKPLQVIIETTDPIDQLSFQFFSNLNETTEQHEQLVAVEPLSVTKIDEHRAVVEIEHFSIIKYVKIRNAYAVFALPFEHLEPGDIVYSISEYLGEAGWYTGHAQMYAGRYQNSKGNTHLRVLESTWTNRGIDCETEAQKITSDTAPEDIERGVHARCDVSRYQNGYTWYATKFDNENVYIGAKRHRGLSESQQSELIEKAEIYLGSPYTLVGVDFVDAYSCVGFVEKAYNDMGLDIAFSGNLNSINSILPPEQFASPWLKDVDRISVKPGDEVNIPVYGYSRDESASLKPYGIEQINNLDEAADLEWRHPTCDQKEMFYEHCSAEDFTPGFLEGTIKEEDIGKTFYLSISAASHSGEFDTKTLFIEVEETSSEGDYENIYEYPELWRVGTITTSDLNDRVTVNGIILESTLNTGHGSDNITVSGKLLRGKIFAGDGNNMLNLRHAHDSTVTSGSGEDNVTLRSETRLRLDTRSGDDTVTINGTLYEGCLRTGADDDVLYVNSRSFVRACINMGPGNDVLVLSGKRSDYGDITDQGDGNYKFVIQLYNEYVKIRDVEAIVFGDGDMIGNASLGEPYKN